MDGLVGGGSGAERDGFSGGRGDLRNTDLSDRPCSNVVAAGHNLPLALGGAVAYGLTYFMTVVARSGRQGLTYGIGILFIDLLLPAAVILLLECPSPFGLGFHDSRMQMVYRSSGAFPAGALVLWTVIALAFPFAAQLVLERAEV